MDDLILPMRGPTLLVWWLPLGAGGRFVRWNGRVYERLCAWRDGRAPQPLFHTALEARVPAGRFIVENAWPIPDEDREARGVVVEGPVFAPAFGRWRALRYEVRRWRDGVIDDAAWAVESPQPVTSDVDVARRALDLVPDVPPLVWGRDAARTGEMWNSNSVVAWLLASAGAPLDDVRPPRGGRAPGWKAGLVVARR